MKWLNLGGGHHITREGYDIDALVELISYFQEKYGLEVYLEPGEAIAIGTGILVGEVLDVVQNEMDIAILDVSATCHMPDILEMPYRPGILGGFDAGEKAYTYRLAGPSCLAGDVIGDWSFEQPLSPGDRLAFLDMAHYTMVKTTTFNGIQHPAHLHLSSRRRGVEGCAGASATRISRAGCREVENAACTRQSRCFVIEKGPHTQRPYYLR